MEGLEILKISRCFVWAYFTCTLLFLLLCFYGVCVFLWLFALFCCLFFKEREEEDVQLEGKGDGDNLEGDEGGETVIQIYGLKKIIFKKKLMRQLYFVCYSVW